MANKWLCSEPSSSEENAGVIIFHVNAKSMEIHTLNILYSI